MEQFKIKKENIEKLSELREQALNILKEYNTLAKKENFGTRIGIIEAVVDDENFGEYNEDSDELVNIKRPKNIAKWLEENDDRPYWDTEFPGVKESCWDPSDINC